MSDKAYTSEELTDEVLDSLPQGELFTWDVDGRIKLWVTPESYRQMREAHDKAAEAHNEYINRILLGQEPPSNR